MKVILNQKNPHLWNEDFFDAFVNNVKIFVQKEQKK